MKRLNLGCGTDIRAGWVNVDVVALPGVDVVHDINRLPYPFQDGEFDEVVAQDILEHVDDFGASMMELHRILKPNGVVHIRVPHFSSRNNHADPTHKRMFSMITFEFFLEQAYDERTYYFPRHFARIDSLRITFPRHRIYFFNYVVEPLVNRSHATQNYYEMTGLSRIFPAQNLEVTLRKGPA